MRFDSLVALTAGLPCFDLHLLVQACDEPRATIRVQLSRWMTAGKVMGLRRGMYALTGAWRRAPLAPAFLAGRLHAPSYLSGLWALAYYELIPERVTWLTSVTTRAPRRFENALGVFDYRSVKRDFFFGYRAVPHDGADLVIADPEKALLDHWHLEPGEWSRERLTQMRYQNTATVAAARLRAFAARFRSPRLERAVGRWLDLAAAENAGTVIL